MFMVDRDPAHRGEGNEHSAKNLLHQVISRSEEAKRPVVGNLLIRLKHRRARTRQPRSSPSEVRMLSSSSSSEDPSPSEATLASRLLLASAS